MRNNYRTKKRFGQHFLHDQSIIDNIITCLNLHEDDELIEIGPGQGVLTLPILSQCKKVTVIEIDNDLIAGLEKLQQKYPALRIVHDDVLNVPLNTLTTGKKMRLVGNLPYNISSPLLFKCFEHLNLIEDMTFMFQKEFAARLSASPESKEYGRLSVMSQFFCHTEMLLTIDKDAFAPPPKVDSAIVKMTPTDPATRKDINIETLSQVVGLAFNQRRKALRNSLKKVISSEGLESLNINPNQRPETLALEAFLKIVHVLSSNK